MYKISLFTSKDSPPETCTGRSPKKQNYSAVRLDCCDYTFGVGIPLHVLSRPWRKMGDSIKYHGNQFIENPLCHNASKEMAHACYMLHATMT